MSILRGGRKLLFAAGLAGCGAAAAVIFTGLNLDGPSFKAYAESGFKTDSFREAFRANSLLNNTSPSKWDNDWDKRDPRSLVRPLKGDFGDLPESERDAYEEKIKKARATATRHLLLVRHGQYNLSGLNDAARTLTELGRGQADMIGLRLKELGLPYTKIIKSTMTRATETADIIHKHFPDLPASSCDFIREGSPIVPDPPSSHWRPQAKVNFFRIFCSFLFSIKIFTVCLLFPRSFSFISSYCFRAKRQNIPELLRPPPLSALLCFLFAIILNSGKQTQILSNQG